MNNPYPPHPRRAITIDVGAEDFDYYKQMLPPYGAGNHIIHLFKNFIDELRLLESKLGTETARIYARDLVAARNLPYRVHAALGLSALSTASEQPEHLQLNRGVSGADHEAPSDADVSAKPPRRTSKRGGKTVKKASKQADEGQRAD